MTTSIQTPDEALIEYPDSDGQPMSDNTLQFQWIVTIEGNLDGLFRKDADVFVAGDLLWYPVEGQPTIRSAPDTMVVFGRPKGYRGSYMQWREGGIAPQVVFEIRSPGNTRKEIDDKFAFYDRYGVEEYYFHDPDRAKLQGWIRVGGRLQPIPVVDGWVSPRLGIRFDLSAPELVIYRPDGQRFLTFVELVQQQELERLSKEHAEQEVQRERLMKQHAEQEAQRERLARQEAEKRVQRLAERLRALGVDPEQESP